MAKRLVQAFQTVPAIVTEMFSTIAVFAEVTKFCELSPPTACNYDPTATVNVDQNNPTELVPASRRSRSQNDTMVMASG